MKQSLFSFCILAVLTAAAALPSAFAKDAPVNFDECPAPVKAMIQHYSAQGTFESVTFDEKKKSGGPAIYEAKFSLRNGKRIEVHISPEGKVIGFEEKKPKN